MDYRNNKLIAEFMGGEITESNQWRFPGDNTCCINCLHYHVDWEWLMKVIDKIENY